MEETKRTRPVQSAGFPFQRIIVTGAAGFIGANFTSLMLSWHPDLHIAGFDSLTYAGSLENLDGCLKNSRFTFIKGDIREKEAVEETFCREKPDAVVNFAAESHVDNSISNPSLFLETNVLGTGVLLDAAVRHGVRFHQVSTDEVYGDLLLECSERFTENSPLRPSSPYSASKAAADLLVLSYCRTYGIKATITRCTNNFGAYQHREKLIPKVIWNALHGLPIPVYGNGLNVREWISAEDHCRAVESVLAHGESGRIYNVGSGVEISNISLIKQLLSILGKDESLIEYVPDRPGHDLRYALDSSRIREELGFSVPEDSFHRRLEEAAAFYRRAFSHPS